MMEVTGLQTWMTAFGNEFLCMSCGSASPDSSATCMATLTQTVGSRPACISPVPRIQAGLLKERLQTKINILQNFAAFDSVAERVERAVAVSLSTKSNAHTSPKVIYFNANWLLAWEDLNADKTTWLNLPIPTGVCRETHHLHCQLQSKVCRATWGQKTSAALKFRTQTSAALLFSCPCGLCHPLKLQCDPPHPPSDPASISQCHKQQQIQLLSFSSRGRVYFQPIRRLYNLDLVAQSGLKSE